MSSPVFLSSCLFLGMCDHFLIFSVYAVVLNVSFFNICVSNGERGKQTKKKQQERGVSSLNSMDVTSRRKELVTVGAGEKQCPHLWWHLCD